MRKKEPGGYIITVMHHKRYKTYIVAEPDRDKAIAILAQKLEHPIGDPIAPLPVPAEALKEHGVKPGHAKRLHL